MACSFFFLVIAYFYFPYVDVDAQGRQFNNLTIANLLFFSSPLSETKQKTLEEVAAAFGDKVVEADEGPKRRSVGGADHIESAPAGTGTAV